MKRYIQTVLILGVTVGLMAYFLRHAQLDRVGDAFKQARTDLLGVSVVLSILTYGIRVERWRWLLRPLGRVDFMTAGRATVMGFAANTLLPGRVGEVLRPMVLARHAPITASAGLATIVVERVLDLLAIVLLLAIAVLLFYPPTSDVRAFDTLQLAAVVSGVAGAAAAVALVLVAQDPARATRAVAWVVRILPSRPRRIALDLAQRFLTGLAVVRQPRALVAAMALSMTLWLGIAAGIWAATEAFGIEVPLAGAMVLTGLVALGVSVPTPAGAGGYHAAFQLGAIALYGAGDSQAVAAGLVNHAIAFVPVTLLGVALMVHEGIGISTVYGLSGIPASSPGIPRGPA